MKWYNSDEFGAKHSSQIFVWDAKANKEIYIHFLGDWEFGANNSSSFCRNFPIWRYVHDGIDPIPRNQPERSKREDSNCFMDCKRSMCDSWDDCICRDHINCKVEMRCSEHGR
jgi:hypothetical protein